MSRQRDAALRCCASCEWIFKMGTFECPKCGFGSYGAHSVYGRKCYKYSKSQQPWIDNQLFAYHTELLHIIKTGRR